VLSPKHVGLLGHTLAKAPKRMCRHNSWWNTLAATGRGSHKSSAGHIVEITYAVLPLAQD